jgi:uncharacterized protein YndB with AHSA1/START domain
MSTMPQMSDEAIRKGSGKAWSEWREVLDAWGAAEKPHAEIARYLVEAHGVDGWWAQGVTVGYEQVIGRRVAGERQDGTFQASASKTIHAGIEAHFTAWVDERERDQWLPAGTLALRTAKDGTSARFDDVEHGTIAALWFTDKGPGKSAVSVQVDRLPDKAAAEAQKALWKARLANLAAYLKG